MWEYMDGAGSEAERAHIAMLIREDESWKTAYEELLAFEHELETGMALQEPQAGFDARVMATIAEPQPVPMMRKYINRTLMRGIAAFFVVSIGVTLLAVLLTTNWAAPATTLALHIPTIDMSGILNSTFVNTAIGIGVVLGLVFVDNTLRARRLRHE
ncbi:hypothetical protein GCM10023093_04520 [Nemorincola caseinilytica]|uniref:Uncharacterized protein n=1 Tax=Nemorincola caseinilytica TaxID=2054315 RepID=A0ABP8N863_9BACT